MSKWYEVHAREWNDRVRELLAFYARVRDVSDNEIVFVLARVTATLGSQTVTHALANFEGLDEDVQTVVVQTLMAMRDLHDWFENTRETAADVRIPWYLNSPILARRVGYLGERADRLVDQVTQRPEDGP